MPVATFAAFGSFALLMFVVFPGTRALASAAYLVLAQPVPGSSPSAPSSRRPTGWR